MPYASRHRRRRTGARTLASVVAVLGVLAVAAVFIVSALPDHSARAEQGRRDRTTAEVAPLPRADGRVRSTAPATGPSSTSPAADPRLVPFASWRGLELHLLARDVRCVCYHEASYHDAMALQPMGRMRKDYNRTKFPKNEPGTDGPDYLIMSSRGRRTPATSAADLVMPRTTKVLSPVSGVVTKVKRYRLYGRYPDFKVEIRPDAAPDMRVAMIHLDDVGLRSGDRVTQGTSVVGRPRSFPFGDQTDLYIAGGDPHVHVEVVDPDVAR